MELSHDEFWSLTPAEYAELAEGYRWREEREWYRTAWLASQIINISGKQVKRKVKPEDFLRRGGTRADKARAFRKLWEKVERQRNGQGR